MTRPDHAPAIAALIIEGNRASIDDKHLATMWPTCTAEQMRRGRQIALEILKAEHAEMREADQADEVADHAACMRRRSPSAPIWVALVVIVLWFFKVPGWWRFWLWATAAPTHRSVS